MYVHCFGACQWTQKSSGLRTLAQKKLHEHLFSNQTLRSLTGNSAHFGAPLAPTGPSGAHRFQDNWRRTSHLAAISPLTCMWKWTYFVPDTCKNFTSISQLKLPPPRGIGITDFIISALQVRHLRPMEVKYCTCPRQKIC